MSEFRRHWETYQRTPEYRARVRAAQHEARLIALGEWLIALRRRHPRTRLLVWIDSILAADRWAAAGFGIDGPRNEQTGQTPSDP